MDDNTYTQAYRRPFTFDRVVRLLISAALIFVAFWLINLLSSVLLPFMVAWLIAYILEPFVQRNRVALRTRGRTVAVIVTLVEVLMLVVVLCVMFVPSIIDETHQMASLMREYAVNNREIKFVPVEVHDFLLRHIDISKLSDTLTRQDIKSIVDAAASFISGGVNIIMGLFDWFLVILYVLFIMIDYDKLIEGFKLVVPPRYRSMVFGVLEDVKDSMNHYFRGQSLIAFMVGILFSIGFLIVGLPLAIVLGLFIGLLNMVPYLQLISIPITTVLCLVYAVQDNVDFWLIWWECMGVYLVVQCIQDLFLTPKVMGKAMGLNPAIILLSLSVWGTLLGFIGMIIALPLTTLVISYYNRYVIHRRDGETPKERRHESDVIDSIVEDSPDKPI